MVCSNTTSRLLKGTEVIMNENVQISFQLKLVNPSDSRFEHLVTQMKWRLQEGQGEAFYEIGVEDNGILAGLTDSELAASIETIDRMARR